LSRLHAAIEAHALLLTFGHAGDVAGSIYVNIRELASYAQGKIGHPLVILFGTALLVDE
jgi:hypothetical protein